LARVGALVRRERAEEPPEPPQPPPPPLTTQSSPGQTANLQEAHGAAMRAPTPRPDEDG